jgi:hypothetical protein
VFNVPLCKRLAQFLQKKWQAHAAYILEKNEGISRDSYEHFV